MKKIIALVSGLIAMFLFVTVAKAAGFDEFGYNRTARIFNGTGETWALEQGLPADYLGIYSKDKLIMKWNAEWDRGNDEGWSNPPYAAWENNEWNGKGVEGGSGAVWHYKIVWVGPQVWDLSGEWGLNFVSTKYPGTYAHTLVIDGETATGASTGNTYEATVSIDGTDVEIVATYLPGSAAFPYTYTAVGTISNTGIGGTWTATDGDLGTWSSTSGAGTLGNGPYWVEGGYRLWGQFETIMDHGVDPSLGPGHIWYIHAIPNGYGSVVN